MPRKILAVALLALATAGGAQTPYSPARHQVVSSDPSGWTWYVVKDSKRLLQSSPKVYRFWMTGVNPQSANRYGKVEVKMACSGSGWYVATHVTIYDTARRIVSNTITGDDAANWVQVEAGKPMAGAFPWACAA
jgi:hypothetical protein